MWPKGKTFDVLGYGVLNQCLCTKVPIYIVEDQKVVNRDWLRASLGMINIYDDPLAPVFRGAEVNYLYHIYFSGWVRHRYGFALENTEQIFRYYNVLWEFWGPDILEEQPLYGTDLWCKAFTVACAEPKASTILLVEGNPFAAHTAQKIWEKYGFGQAHDLIVCSDPDQAVKMIANHEVGFVITAISFPEKTK